MRMSVCDVCEEKFVQDALMMEMKIPVLFLGEDDDIDTVLDIDVCSWDCLKKVADARVGDDQEDTEEQEVQEVPPAPVVPPAHTEPTLPGLKLSEISDAELDKMTEQITGVKRKW